MIISVTIWMGIRERDWLGNGLDGNGTCDLSRKRAVYQLPWFYRGKIAEVSPGTTI